MNKSKWVSDIHRMQTKFNTRDVVEKMSPDMLYKFLEFRGKMLQEEVDEYHTALTSKDPAQNEDVVDAIIDLCVFAIGTLDALGVDADEAWDRVFQANIVKEVGVKATRPNPLGFPDLIKPEGWKAPHHEDNIGLLSRLYETD